MKRMGGFYHKASIIIVYSLLIVAVSGDIAVAAPCAGKLTVDISFDDGSNGTLSCAVSSVKNGQTITIQTNVDANGRTYDLSKRDNVTVNGNNYTIRNFSTTTSARFFDIGKGTTLRNITIVGNSASNAYAIYISSQNVLLKGLTIYGMTDGYGIYLKDDSNTVESSFIGTDSSGAPGLGNKYGIVIDTKAADKNTIGGDTEGKRNYISGNTLYGIWIFNGDRNEIKGNYIGLKPNGTEALPNGTGIYISSSSERNTISGNFISGNTEEGVRIDGGQDRRNTVSNNWIGTAADGDSALGNGRYGIYIINGSDRNAISLNTIAFNQKGVVIGQNMSDSATRNEITQNHIYQNSVIGIDLGNDGVTENDGVCNSGSQPNRGMDFPVITGVSLSGNQLKVQGTTSCPQANSVEVFKSDPVNSRQGRYLGRLPVPPGTGSFNGTLTVSGVLPSDSVTATAMDSEGNTSEFSDSKSLGGGGRVRIIRWREIFK